MSSVSQRSLQHVMTLTVVSPLQSAETLEASYLLGDDAHAVFDAMCGAFREVNWTKSHPPTITMSALLGAEQFTRKSSGSAAQDNLISTLHAHLAYQVVDSVPLKTHFGRNRSIPVVDVLKDPLYNQLLRGEEVDLEGPDGAELVRRLAAPLMSKEYAVRSPQGYLAALRLLAQLPGEAARDALVHLHNRPPYAHSSNGKKRVLERKEDDELRVEILVKAISVRDFVEVETRALAGCENDLQFQLAVDLLTRNLEGPVPVRSPNMMKMLRERLETLPFKNETYRLPSLNFVGNHRFTYKPKPSHPRSGHTHHAPGSRSTARAAERFPLHQLEVFVPASRDGQPLMNATLQVPGADAHDLYQLFSAALKPTVAGRGPDPVVTMTEVYAPPGERVGLKQTGEQTLTPYLHAWLGFEALRMRIDPSAGVLPLDRISQDLGTQDLLAPDLELTPADHEALLVRLQGTLGEAEYAAACPEGYLAALQLFVRIPGEAARDAIFKLFSEPPYQPGTQTVLLKVEDERLRQTLLVGAVKAHRFMEYKLAGLAALTLDGDPDEATNAFQVTLDRFRDNLHGMWKRTPNLGDVVLALLNDTEFRVPGFKAMAREQMTAQFDDRGFFQQTLGVLREALGSDQSSELPKVSPEVYRTLIQETAALLRPRVNARGYLEATLMEELGKTFRRSSKLGSDIVRDLRRALKPSV